MGGGRGARRCTSCCPPALVLPSCSFTFSPSVPSCETHAACALLLAVHCFLPCARALAQVHPLQATPPSSCLRPSSGRLGPPAAGGAPRRRPALRGPVLARPWPWAPLKPSDSCRARARGLAVAYTPARPSPRLCNLASGLSCSPVQRPVAAQARAAPPRGPRASGACRGIRPGVGSGQPVPGRCRPWASRASWSLLRMLLTVGCGGLHGAAAQPAPLNVQPLTAPSPPSGARRTRTRPTPRWP
jgi:hypothetical protein